MRTFQPRQAKDMAYLLKYNDALASIVPKDDIWQQLHRSEHHGH
jgi:hypothetical protein